MAFFEFMSFWITLAAGAAPIVASV